MSQVLLKLDKVFHRDAAATANDRPQPSYECASLPICHCWLSAVLLPVDMDARVHTDTLALRRAVIGILNRYCSVITAFKHNYLK